MSSVLRSVRKRKKGHTLGAVDVIDREEYAELEVDAKVALIRSLVPLGLMHIRRGTLVGTQVIQDQMQRLVGRRGALEATQELDELLTPVAPAAFANHHPVQHAQRRIQRGRAVRAWSRA